MGCYVAFGLVVCVWGILYAQDCKVGGAYLMVMFVGWFEGLDSFGYLKCCFSSGCLFLWGVVGCCALVNSCICCVWRLSGGIFVLVLAGWGDGGIVVGWIVLLDCRVL